MVYLRHHILITNLMHWLLFIHKIIFSSTCFEPQVLIFRRRQLCTCSIWYSHSLWEFLVACRYTAWVYRQANTCIGSSIVTTLIADSHSLTDSVILTFITITSLNKYYCSRSILSNATTLRTAVPLSECYWQSRTSTITILPAQKLTVQTTLIPQIFL